MENSSFPVPSAAGAVKPGRVRFPALAAAGRTFRLKTTTGELQGEEEGGCKRDDHLDTGSIRLPPAALDAAAWQYRRARSAA